jgi:hypothetical protein
MNKLKALNTLDSVAFAINTLIFAFGSLFIYLVRTRRRQPLTTEPEEQALTGEFRFNVCLDTDCNSH